MAYLARIEPLEGRSLALPAMPGGAAPRPHFSPLEWSVIWLARGDGLETLREPGRIRRFFAWLTGLKDKPRLANGRLEALRRIAVLSWRFGFSVPGEDVAEFLSAGFTPDQYELLVTSVRAGLSKPRSISGEVLV